MITICTVNTQLAELYTSQEPCMDETENYLQNVQLLYLQPVKHIGIKQLI